MHEATAAESHAPVDAAGRMWHTHAMPGAEANPTRGVKLTPRYLATLVAAAALILVVGSALRPPKRSSENVPPPSAPESRRLQRLAERQSLETTASHFAAIASDVAAGLVQVGPASSTGIAWETDLVVSPGQAGPAAESTTLQTAAGEDLVGTRSVGGPDLPFCAYRAAGRLQPVARRMGPAPEPAAGQWLLAVWRGSTGLAFVPGHYVETRPARCGGLEGREVASSLELTAAMAGAGLFDLDGALLGLVLPCDGRYAALTPESVALGLAQGRGVEARLRSRYGLGLRPLDEPLRRYLGLEGGLLVSEVWSGYAGERAGLRPGDVVVSADGRSVAGELQALLAPPGPAGVQIGVLRAGKSREVVLGAGVPERASPAPPDAPGMRLAPPADGYAIAQVADGSPAAEAGIGPGDRLLRVDFSAPRSAEEARRVLAGNGGQPVFVEVQSGRRRFGALLRRP